MRGIHQSPVNSPHKRQWRGALLFSLICVWINGWINNREAGDLRRYRAHYDVTVMNAEKIPMQWRQHEANFGKLFIGRVLTHCHRIRKQHKFLRHGVHWDIVTVKDVNFHFLSWSFLRSGLHEDVTNITQSRCSALTRPNITRYCIPITMIKADHRSILNSQISRYSSWIYTANIFLEISPFYNGTVFYPGCFSVIHKPAEDDVLQGVLLQ